MTSPNEPKPVALHCQKCGANLTPNAIGYVVCQYCGTNLIWTHPDAGAYGPQPVTALRGMRLKQFSYTDTQGTGLELFRALIPVGWQFEGGYPDRQRHFQPQS